MAVAIPTTMPGGHKALTRRGVLTALPACGAILSLSMLKLPGAGIPLRRLVLLVDAVRGGANAELLLSRMQAHFCRLFQVTGRSATAYHRNLLLQWSRPVVEAFAALPLFEDRREEDALPPDPQGE